MTRLQGVVCLLLAGLLLYNPFLSLIHSSSELSVHHLSRNRATIGSAELQHFSPVSNEMSADILPEKRTGEIIAASGGQESQLATDLLRDRIITPDFSSNLWFRPPPSA
ncbi:MAG TPA: hypothetical protein VFB10_14780 [Candidatus Dormibacteraeota bacterium]|nr:hypothetical protein [Candidatus Dormibacteraeota bacterium]